MGLEHFIVKTLSPPRPSSLMAGVESLTEAALVETGAEGPRRVALVGAADDLGVALNNGRPGAADGPGAIRAALGRLTFAFDALTRRSPGNGLSVFDAGDVQPATPEDVDESADRRQHPTAELTLFETHRRLREGVRELHEAGFVTVGLGGGHDLTLAMVEGARAGRLVRDGGDVRARFGGVNVDAHLDVRETIGSGMPFRALIERGVLAPERFTVLGAARFAATVEQVRWLETECCPELGGARIVTLEEARGIGVGNLFPMRAEESLRRARVLGDGYLPGFVTFDLDAVDASAAPGVSAPNVSGMTSAEALHIAELAGASPGVVHFDVMEMNPEFDADGRTARLAAHLVLSFLVGLSRRDHARSDAWTE